MWRVRSSRTVVTAAAIAAFALVAVLPLAYMAAVALRDGWGGTAAAGLALDARQRGLLSNTVVLGVGTALLATLIGAPAGLAFARMPLRAKGFLRIALGAPVLLPTYVIALAWISLGGSAGLVARALGRDVLSAWTYSLPGAIVVLSLVLYPLSMLATEASVRRVDPRLEEAALVVAPPGRVLLGVTLPLAAPGIGAAALVIFVLAVSEFGVPGLLRVRVFTTEVFTAFAALYDFGRATSLAVPLVVVTVAVAFVAGAIVGDRVLTGRRGAVGTGGLSLDAWQPAAGVLLALVPAVALGLPILVLLSEALGAPLQAAVLHGWERAVWNSFVFAGTGATLVVIVAIWIGYARARSRARSGRLADALCLALFAAPSTVLGVGLIGVWNRPGLPGELYGTDGMILLAYLGRFLPVATLMLAAAVRQVPESMEEAAAVAGAGWLRTMTHIVGPQIRPALLATWVIVFVLCSGELGATILVAPAGDATLPIRIYTLIANAPPSHIAALALLQTATVLAPLALLGLWIARRRR